MDEPQNWPARLAAPQRNNFFFGKMMGVTQFDREQRYGMGQRWLLNRLTVGAGVLCGLEVKLTADGKRLRVAPGVAVDPWGREIVVAHPVEFDPFAAGGGCGCSEGAPITEPKDYTLCLTYRECSTNDQPVQYADDCPDQPDCEPDSTVETFALGLSTVQTLVPFDCAAWTAPVPGTAARPAPVLTGSHADVGGVAAAHPPIGLAPSLPTASAAAAPDIALLRSRLAEQFGTACAPPASNCVPLALVTARREGDEWSLSLSDGPRRRIYTQAQLLEMILCLAKCCGSGHPEVPPTDTLKIMDLQFLRITATGAPVANFPPRLDPVSPRQAGVYPLVFDALPASRDTWDPLVLRVVFNKAVEGSTVVAYPLLPKQPLGYALTRTPPGGTEAEVSGITSLLEDANSLLLICPGDPGVYTLVMRGDPVAATASDPALPAVTTWDLDPAKRRRLDGDNVPPQFPSGVDNTEGGDFIFQFVLSRKP